MKALGWYGPVNEEQEKKGLGRQMEEDSRRGNALYHLRLPQSRDIISSSLASPALPGDVRSLRLQHPGSGL